MILAPSDDATLLELILRLIGHLERRLSERDWTDFVGNIDEIDLSAYRLLHIGEAGNRLSQDLRGRYPDFRWRAMYRMRNILAHVYSATDALTIWEAVHDELPPLKRICEAELVRQ